ncbi:MAG: HAD-IIIA family hydrolase [Pseudomonadales bacterium]
MLFIFDWDGTLLDSTAKIVRAMQSAIAKHNMPARSDEEAKGIIGLGLPEAVMQLYPGISAQMLIKLRDSYAQFFIDADQTPCNFYPHVQNVLAELRAQGHLLAVATGKSRRGLNRVFNNLNRQDFFDASRCADETASKPNPLMLNQLLDELDCDVSQAVMVGDTAFDLEMASNAGMKSIAVSYGAHSEERLLKHKPVLYMDSFNELLSWERGC